MATTAAERIPVGGSEREGGHLDALVAIVFAALAVEAFVNEFAEVANDAFYWDTRVTPSLESLGAAVATAERERASSELKLHVIRCALSGGPWSRSEGAFQNLGQLFRLRNALAHLKLDVREGEVGSEEAGVPPKLIESLRAKNILAVDVDAASASWTVVVGTRATAEWACTTAAGVVKETIDLVPPSQLRDDLQRFLGRHFGG